MRRNSHKTTSGVKFDSIFELFVPDCLYYEKFWKLDHDFRQPIFYYACAGSARKLLPVKFLTTNLKFLWAVSYSNTNLAALSKIYTCFARKIAFVMQNVCNLGILGVGVNFFDETPITHILPWFHAFWAIEPSRVFAPGVCTKKGTQQKVTERLYFTYLEGIPHRKKILPNWHTSNDRRRNQSHQDWQWSVQGVQSYGGPNFGLLHRNGLSPITL